MTNDIPGEIEVCCYFRQHIGPKFEIAGLGVQFHYNQSPGVHFKVPVSDEYRPAILKGIEDGMALRFPDFPASGSIWIIDVREDEVGSSYHAFYRAARAVIDQTRSLKDST